MQKIRVLEFENCTFGNVEGPVQPTQYSLPVRQAVLGLPHLQRYSFSISRKIQARESPEKYKGKKSSGSSGRYNGCDHIHVY